MHYNNKTPRPSRDCWFAVLCVKSNVRQAVGVVLNFRWDVNKDAHSHQEKKRKQTQFNSLDVSLWMEQERE